MTARALRLVLAAAAATGVFALTGCGTITISTDPSASPTTSSSATPKPTTEATAADGLKTADQGAGADGQIPNPCTLLTPADVNKFTSREITQIDRSGAESGETRYCQWQLEQGVLAVFLSSTSASDFEVRDPAAVDVNGIGDDAFTSAGHLYVRSGDLSIDVYSTSADGDASNFRIAKTVAQHVIDQL